MNEELKIIIKAITDGAEKELAAVRGELGKIKGEAEKADKATATIKAMGVAATVALGAITALSAGIVNLGKSSLELQKTQGKLISNFQALGSSAAQAQETYQGLYRFLGDNDKATEAANLLGRMTTDTEELAEWTTILEGAYASFGDALPVEGLAEAANETAKVGKVVGTMADALNWAGVSEDAFNAKLATLNSETEREAYIRSTLTNLYANAAYLYERNNAALINYNNSQARLNTTLANVGKSVTPLLTALNNLAATMLQLLSPAIQTIVNYLIVLVQWITTAATYIASFFGAFKSKSDSTTSSINAMSGGIYNLSSGVSDLGGAFDNAAASAAALKKQTMGFDELNVVSKPTTTASGGGSVSGGGVSGGLGDLGSFSVPDVEIPDLGISDFTDGLKEAEEKLKSIAALAGLVALTIGGFKLTSFIKDLAEVYKIVNMNAKKAIEIYGKDEVNVAAGKWEKWTDMAKQMGAIVLGVAGTMALLWGWSDAWVNGIDWLNLVAVLGGVAAILGSLYLSFGMIGVTVGAAAAAVALFVLGIKDFINNGPTVQNTILILGGAVATAVALATAGVSVLISVIIAAAAAVLAFVAAIVFEKSAILDVEEAQEKLNEAKEKAAEAENNYVNAVDAAESSLKRLENAEKAAGITGEELYKQVQSGTLDYADMTDAQKEVYKAYLDNEKKQADLEASTKALTEAKKAEKIASLENEIALGKEAGSYDKCKESIIKAFEEGSISAEEARDLLEKAMSEMSDDAQQTFMNDLPNSIKDGMDPNKYETVRKKMGDWFKKAGDFWIKEIWNPIKSFWNSKIAPIFTKQWWQNKFDAIKLGARAAINGAIIAVENGINNIISKINLLSWKVPDWVPKIGGSTFGFNFRSIHIPRLAEGGIVSSSILANIGENGKEAVLPLENNTGWMDILADKINERNNTPSKIVLMLDGKELGWANIKSINNITKQTGSLQLQLV